MNKGKENGLLSNACAGILNMCFQRKDAVIPNSVTNMENDVRKLETSVKPTKQRPLSTSIVKAGLIYRHHGKLVGRERHLEMISLRLRLVLGDFKVQRNKSSL